MVCLFNWQIDACVLYPCTRLLIHARRGAVAPFTAEAEAAGADFFFFSQLLLLLQKPWPLALIINTLRFLGQDHQKIFVMLVRSYGHVVSVRRLVQRIQRRPSIPLLRMLARRLRTAALSPPPTNARCHTRVHARCTRRVCARAGARVCVWVRRRVRVCRLCVGACR